ncbi:MAG: hypothetical protein Q8P54_01925 [bacterium]|nr:hypothetical protein [bacterium]
MFVTTYVLNFSELEAEIFENELKDHLGGQIKIIDLWHQSFDPSVNDKINLIAFVRGFFGSVIEHIIEDWANQDIVIIVPDEIYHEIIVQEFKNCAGRLPKICAIEKNASGDCKIGKIVDLAAN